MPLAKFVSACICLAALAAGCGPDTNALIPPPGKYDARILRDAYGVPHIFGKRDLDAAYGLAYAHCEDDWINMRDAILMVRGRMAAVHGKNFAPFDYLFALFKVREFVDAKYDAEISPDVRALLEAYADGVNHYAALHPKNMRHLPLPVTGRDIVAGATFKSPFFYELQHTISELFGLPLSRKGVVKSAALSNPLDHGAVFGSNAWAVAPARSADGATRFAINSHQPWTGPVAWYEAHVRSEEGWNMIGGTFPGGPVIFKGHDEVKGWCHTINRPDLADVYELELNPANDNQYRLDGAWKGFEQSSVRITVKLWGPFSWTVKRPLLWSEHGPVIRNEDRAYAVRFAGYGEVGQLEQWYRMNKARTLDEFLAAMRMHKLVSLNTVYADKDGNIFYAYNGHFPKRLPGIDWKGRLPGNRSDLIWKERYAFEDLPQILNPASAFLQSCNNSPYRSTVGPENPTPDHFAPEMGIEFYMTNRSLRALELYGGDDSITREEFYAYKYDKTYSADSEMAEFIARLGAATLPEELRPAAAAIAAWDRVMNKESTTAALAILAGEPYMDYKRWGGAEPDLVDLLRNAVAFLNTNFGRIDVPWGELMRLRRGAVDLPLGGGPDCLRALDNAKTPDGRLMGVNGDCYFLMAEWDANGNLRSEGIHQFGAASTDPASPHYADQAPLFAGEKLKPTWLREEDIRANLKREYRPGDFTGPWYAVP